jgi:hypothetical protein
MSNFNILESIRKVTGTLFHLVLGKRILLPNYLSKGTEASELINRMIQLRNFKGCYLEIGVENGLTLEAIKLKRRVGVDPHPRFRVTYLTPWVKFYKLTSDTFFDLNNQCFDVVYLDGLHTAEQTLCDLHNALKKLNKGGVVVIDDTVPNDEYSALPDQNETYRLRKLNSLSNDMSWHGDVYKVINILQTLKHSNLHVSTITSLQNPKTVIWSDSETPATFWEPTDYFDALHQKDYAETFSIRIPSNFNPMRMQEFEEYFKKL